MKVFIEERFCISSLVQAKRNEIEGALTLLLNEIVPSDEKLITYERAITRAIKKRLSSRANVLKKAWFRNKIRGAFDAHRERRVQNNAHVKYLAFVGHS